FGSVAYGFVSDLWFKGRRPPATLLFGVVEVVALVVMFFGPRNAVVLTGALVVYGFTLSGILAVLGGLLAVDVASKRAAGMAMGRHGRAICAAASCLVMTRSGCHPRRGGSPPSRRACGRRLTTAGDHENPAVSTEISW